MKYNVKIMIILLGCVLGACGTEEDNKAGNSDGKVNKEGSKVSTKNVYDPHLISIGDTSGEMKAKTINVKDINGDMTLVDIQFESDHIEITGKFNNFKGDYHVLNFLPNEESKAKFPHHNLFEYDTTLNFFDEKILMQFGKRCQI
jgi:hypothetical protein